MHMLYEACVIGLITLIVGKIGFYLTSTERTERDQEKEKTNYNIVFFLIGFVLHFIIEYIGLNKWYCDKCIA
jgi:hypothetical protein